jgi:regulatory protein
MRHQQQASRPRRPRTPLDPATIRALALHYVGRYATTQARLRQYLERKLRERGWAESTPEPALEQLVNEFAKLGYVDDDAFAAARVTSLLRRGFGENRLNAALRQAGIAADKAEMAARLDHDSAQGAAMAFARRKRLGPFGAPLLEAKARSRALAAFLRAGHSYEVAREILALANDDSVFRDFYG